MKSPITLDQVAAALDQAVSTHPRVNEWIMPMPGNQLYTDAWMVRNVDSVNVVYRTKDLELGVGIFSKEGNARVILRFTHALWQEWDRCINPVQLSLALNAAITMAEFMWNNHLGITSEGAVPSSYIEIDA